MDGMKNDRLDKRTGGNTKVESSGSNDRKINDCFEWLKQQQRHFFPPTTFRNFSRQNSKKSS